MFRWLASSIGLAVVKGELSALVQRAARRGALYLAVLLLWLLAFGFALAAFTVWLATVIGPIWACAAVAAFFAVIGLVVQVSLALTSRRQAQTASPFAGLSGISDAASAATASNPLGSLALVAVIGWLLGRQMSGGGK